jgi:hypothetical protein
MVNLLLSQRLTYLENMVKYKTIVKYKTMVNLQVSVFVKLKQNKKNILVEIF